MEEEPEAAEQVVGTKRESLSAVANMEEEPPEKKRKLEEELEEARAKLFKQLDDASSLDYFYFQEENMINTPFTRSSTLPLRLFSKKIETIKKQGNPFEPINLGHVKYYSYSKLQEITNNFSEGNLIRPVRIGQLFRGQIEQQEVIVKTWDIFFGSLLFTQHHPARFRKEIGLLTNPDVAFNHSLVKLIGYCCEKKLAVVYELKLEKTVEDRIPSVDFPLDKRIKVASDIAEVLKLFHSKQMAFCSLDAASISIDENYNIKCFDLAGHLNLEGATTVILPDFFGNAKYFSPEFYKGDADKWLNEWTFASDIYAYGVLILELITGRVCEGNRNEFIKWVENQVLGVDKNSTPYETLEKEYVIRLEILKLGIRCVQKELSSRPKIEEVAMELKKAKG